MQQRVGQLVLLTCPTDRLTLPAKAGHLRVAHTRNQQLRAMVAEGRGGTAPPPANGTASGGGGGAGAGQGAAPLMLLDIDALTRRLPAELTIGPQVGTGGRWRGALAGVATPSGRQLLGTHCCFSVLLSVTRPIGLPLRLPPGQQLTVPA